MRRWFLTAILLCAALVMGYLTTDTEVAIAHHYTMTSCSGNESSGYSFTVNYTSGSSETFGPYTAGTHPEGGQRTGEVICNYHRNNKLGELGAVHTRPPFVVPTRVPTQTPTPIPPTVTNTATATHTPTVTPTITQTPTRVPPTATRRPAGGGPRSTAPPTVTATTTPTVTSTITPTAVPDETVTATITLTTTPTAVPDETATPTITLTTTPTPTPRPELQAMYVGSNSIRIAWERIEGAKVYDLWVWWAADPGWQHLTYDEVTEYLHEALAPGTTYFYTVRGCGDDRCGAYRRPYAHVRVPAPLETPVLEAAHTDTGTVTVSWDPVPGAQGYEVWAWWATDPGWQLLGDGIPGTRIVHSGLTAGTTYYYAIGANQAYSGWSAYVSIQISN